MEITGSIQIHWPLGDMEITVSIQIHWPLGDNCVNTDSLAFG